MMLLAANLLLVLAISGGLTLAILASKGHQLPAFAGYGHGALAASGVVVLTLAAIEAGSLLINSALLLFYLALIGGVFVLLFRLQGERPPGFMVALHGFFALCGLVLMLIGSFSG